MATFGLDGCYSNRGKKMEQGSFQTDAIAATVEQLRKDIDVKFEELHKSTVSIADFEDIKRKCEENDITAQFQSLQNDVMTRMNSKMCEIENIQTKCEEMIKTKCEEMKTQLQSLDGKVGSGSSVTRTSEEFATITEMKKLEQAVNSSVESVGSRIRTEVHSSISQSVSKIDSLESSMIALRRRVSNMESNTTLQTTGNSTSSTDDHLQHVISMSMTRSPRSTSPAQSAHTGKTELQILKSDIKKLGARLRWLHISTTLFSLRSHMLTKEEREKAIKELAGREKELSNHANEFKTESGNVDCIK